MHVSHKGAAILNVVPLLKHRFDLSKLLECQEKCAIVTHSRFVRPIFDRKFQVKVFRYSSFCSRISDREPV